MRLSLIIVLLPWLCFAKLRGDIYDTPKWSKFKEAAFEASDTYHFKIPFYTGLAAFLLFDGDISNRASRDTPIFGSKENAKKWTDGLLLSLIPLMIYTAKDVEFENTIAKDDDTLFWKRTKLIAFQSMIIAADFFLIHAIKTSSKRVRPDASDSLSFPSGHSSVSSGLSRTIFNNIKNSPHKDSLYGNIMQRGTFAVSTAVAWGRVEAKKHHLSDVLLGNAFGAFISDFLYGAFLENNKSVSTSMFILGDEQHIRLSFAF